jgi:hypothetical protein
MGVEENPRRLPALKEALFSGPHNAVLIDAGGGAVAMPCLVCIAVALAAIRNASEQRRTSGLL